MHADIHCNKRRIGKCNLGWDSMAILTAGWSNSTCLYNYVFLLTEMVGLEELFYIDQSCTSVNLRRCSQCFWTNFKGNCSECFQKCLESFTALEYYIKKAN